MLVKEGLEILILASGQIRNPMYLKGKFKDKLKNQDKGQITESKSNKI